MKIAIYSHSIAPSIDGVCRRFNSIIRELLRLGHTLLLFTLESRPEDVPPEVTVVTVDYMIIPSYPDKKVFRPNLRSFAAIWAALRSFNPDVVHITGDGSSHMFALIGLLMKIPVVGSFHTDILDLLATHHAHPFQKWCITTKEKIDSYVLDSCATTSNSFSRKLASQGLHCEHIIRTAVDNSLFSVDKLNPKLRSEMLFGDENGFLCVYVGRISKEKRIDVIVDACRAIPGCYLAIVGDGPSAPQYVKMHGKESRIYCKPKFLSHSELAEFYASCDLHVSASEFETLGNTVLEAFSCNKTVVVPRTQGFLDTVNHGVNGFHFTPSDSADARRYIEIMKSDTSLRQKFSDNARLSVQDYSINKVVCDILGWYQVGISKRSQRGWIKWILSLAVLSGFVPFAVVALGIYDMLMNFLMMCGYDPVAVGQQKEESGAHNGGGSSGGGSGKDANKKRQ